MAERILVTGANGFVGAVLCRRLQESGFLVRGTVRDQAKQPQCGTSESNDFE
ncbi:MAG TPA: NAD-dependent epimerase/dehydratase family protein, partial [Bacteroidota bacterium]|nr:NAD-dependent epimerase/dehydratase family protein [Bacteroidota bacterium]